MSISKAGKRELPDHATGVNLLRELGRERAEQLLPEAFKLSYSSHDTGCQILIYVDNWVEVWRGSIWYSDRYEFNEKGKLHGLHPDFEFARDVIADYFDNAKAWVAKIKESQAMRAAERAAEEQNKRQASIAALRSKLGVSNA